ncbi:MAG: hypothetical protein ACLTDS_09300 [Bianqueaceae bacterium]
MHAGWRTTAAVSGHTETFLAITVETTMLAGKQDENARRLRVTAGTSGHIAANSRHHRRNDHAGRETS